MWGITVTLGVLVLTLVVVLAVGYLGLVLGCAGLIALIVFAIWSIVLFVRLRAALAQVLAMSAEHAFPVSSAEDPRGGP
jgi:hypothetical protein